MSRPPCPPAGSPKTRTRAKTTRSERDRRRDGPIQPEEFRFAQRLLEAAGHGDRHMFDALPHAERASFLTILRELVATGHSSTAEVLWELDYDCRPVSIQTFLNDPTYLGDIGRCLYEPWRRELHHVLDPRHGISEWILTGAIGTGKTTAAVIALLYRLYRLTCLRDPQRHYDLVPGSPIVFGFFNLTLDLAHSVSYRKFLNIFRASPYFQRLVPARIPRVTDRINLPKNIVFAVGSNVLHALGHDMIGGILSEVNFGRSPDAQQVVELYTGVKRRVESRFLRADSTLHNPGLLVIDSSRRDESDWLERHITACASSPTVHVTAFALWDVKPLAGPRFTVVVGNRLQKSKILDADEPIPLGTPPEKVVRPPERFRSHFAHDLEGALRDVAGVAIYADAPLITDPRRVEACIDPDREHPFSSVSISLSLDDPRALMQWVREPVLFDRSLSPAQSVRLKLNPRAPRFIHVDLALTRDCAALAMCHVSGWMVSTLPNADGTVAQARVPVVTVDLMLRIVPPLDGQIDLGKIRAFILMLRARGVPIAQASYDRFQSADSLQILDKEGIPAKVVSVDKNPEAYFALRAAIDEQRIRFYRYPPFIDEITTVQFDPIRKRVDHRAGRSKDCADAVAGALFAAITDTEARTPLPPLDPRVDRGSPFDDHHWVLGDHRDAALITAVNVW